MDIEALADQSARTARLHRLRMPEAVRMVLKERGFSDTERAKEYVSSVCRELQKRSTARRKKNNTKKDYTNYIDDMFDAERSRGGDPDDWNL